MIRKITTFVLPNCNYCSVQKDCKVQLDKDQRNKILEVLGNIKLPNNFGFEVNCMYFSPNPDAFKILVKADGEIECLGVNNK